VLAVGDIHTKRWIISLVESVVEEYDKVVFVGDYADDWNADSYESIDTWQRLKTLSDKNSDKIVVLQGNHDHIYVNDTSSLQSGYDHMTKYLIDMPSNKTTKEWLAGLPYVVKIDGVTYSHAGIDDRWDEKDMWTDTSPIWVRPNAARYKKMRQVVGHTPQRTVTRVEPNIWLIDTFSTHPNGSPIGDGTMLEIIDGKKFNKIKIHADNNNTSSFKSKLPRQGA
ncbi:MAG: metallophosphoesterase, partial [Candidatus Saccharibacteria bacterium]|nr:metallophosphoesterase [Candidatus Saccharibacteria bacterium]